MRSLAPYPQKHGLGYNDLMNEKHISQLETQLERLVENVFTSLFRKVVSAHDIAVKIARSMTTHLHTAIGDDPRPVAPNRYRIFINPQVQAHLGQIRPNLPDLLSQHITELATKSGYRLLQAPKVLFVAHPPLDTDDLIVEATHDVPDEGGTAAMQPVSLPQAAPPMACYLIVGERHIPLKDGVINLGRSDDNHIIIDDPFVSRHHVQLRLRFGAYTLFDAQSTTGTFVNEVVLREHRLQSGDVIRIGNTRMIFMVDHAQGRNTSFGTTDIIHPVPD